MLYIALPPVPPPIVITLPSEKVTDEPPLATISEVNKSTKPSIQNSGIANRATAPNLVCISLQTQSPTSNRIKSLLRKTKSEGQTENCNNQDKKFDVLNLEARLRKQQPVIGFSPIPKAPTLAKYSPLASLATENKTVTSSSVIGAEKVNSSNSISNEQSQEQVDPALIAFEKIAEKNAIKKILITVQELINFSLTASLKNNFDKTIKPETLISQSINSPVAQEILNSQVTKSEKQEVARVPETAIDKISSDNYHEKFNTQKLTSALNQISQKNTIASILTAVQELINLSLPIALKNTTDAQNLQKIASSTSEQTSPPQLSPSQETREKKGSDGAIELARVPGEPFLVGVIINGREVGTLDIIQEGSNLFIPLERFAEIVGFTIENPDDILQLKTPLGVIKLQPDSLKQINGVTYITKTELQKELKISVELNTGDLTLLTDLPWRRDSRQYQPSAAQLKPDFFPSNNGISNFRQELNFYRNGDGDTDFLSSTILGGRILGLAYHLRLDNTFEERPDISEYYLYKRSGQFRYQVGRQQIGLHPLINGLDLTGFQVGYSNLPAEYFGTSYRANELLPRRSSPIQTFRGQAPPASFVQLRVGGNIVAQQQVGFNGQYEFIDVNLPVNQSSEIEVVIYERSNLRVPLEIRSLRINASDLLLPAGGNVQLAGLGFNGNLVQKGLFGESNYSDDGKLVGFYQLRQGLTKDLTFEGSVQAVPNALQSQAGLVWRIANPVILSASVGNSYNKIGYSADLDIQLNRLNINAKSESFPEGYTTGKKNGERYNHSLDFNYRFGNRLNLGFIARSRKDDSESTDYILPTFYARPLSNLSLSGRPDIEGKYLLNAFYQPTDSTRLSFNSYGDAYISDLSYKLNRNYQLSFGTEFGGDLAPRYSVGVGHYPNSLNKLSWNVGLAYSDGEVGPLVGASMQVLPGLLARVDYQGIPSRGKGYFGGFGDDRLTVSLVSDMSFAGGKMAPASYIGIGKERGAIAGRLVVEGENKGFDLSGSVVRVYDKRNRNVSSSRTDSKGNFFVGNLPDGIYVVEIEPEELPVELSVMKTSAVAEVATSAVTNLNFPVRPEFGVAGRITDIAGQPVEQVRVELMNSAGARVLSAVTDSFGLYRLDGVPVGFYTLRVSTQDSLNPNDTLPKREIQIRNQFVYDQNLQLPISAAAKKK